MNHRFRTVLACAAVLIVLTAVNAQNSAAARLTAESRGKPWMLFVNDLYPPRGRALSEAFSKACYERLRLCFDTTSYQVVLLQRNQFPEHLTNRKKDIVLSSDKRDFFARGEECDTLIVWMRYMVGFTHARVAVPYERKNASRLPELVAREVLATALAEFMGHLTLEGGPAGVAMQVTEDLVAYPPCQFFIPPGRYGITASFPGFASRTDTIEILPAHFVRKRILLLPQ